jgi:hypothetical protein
VACAENRAKLTPRPSHVAPRGWGKPSESRERRKGVVFWGEVFNVLFATKVDLTTFDRVIGSGTV